MKTLRETCAITILSLTLVLSVSAGQIECPGVVSPPPPPPDSTATSNDATTTASNITTSVILAIVGLIN